MNRKEPNVRAKFYKRDGDGVAMVEIAIVGSKDIYVGKAQPHDVERFPEEYAAFEKGQDEIDVGGTPLTDVPGVTSNIARAYKLRGVRNAEELAALSDGACSSMGMGALTARNGAKNLIAARRADALEAQLAAVQEKRGPGRPPKTEAA